MRRQRSNVNVLPLIHQARRADEVVSSGRGAYAYWSASHQNMLVKDTMA